MSKYTFENFFDGTYAEWVRADFGELWPLVNRTPDYVSNSGSRYWYTADRVYRLSDHWGDVASCYWPLSCGPVNVLTLASCNLDRFIPVCDRPMPRAWVLAKAWSEKATKRESELFENTEKKARTRTFESLFNPLLTVAEQLARGKLAGIPRHALEGSWVGVSSCVYSGGSARKPAGSVCWFLFRNGRPYLGDMYRGCTDREVTWILSETAKEWLCNNV